MDTSNEKRRHIVIVDDDPVNLELAENTIKDFYKITKLISGEQLLKFLERIKPDMILLDVQMPGLSGYQVLEKISKNPERNRIPVIFLTGQSGIDSEREGFRLGAKDFITKPFDPVVMRARIRSQMELYIYRTELEDIVEEKTKRISNLQHVLTISWAEMIESRDGTTGSHVRNTTAYYEVIMKAMLKKPSYAKEFPEDMLEEVLRASTLHDIGKIGIDDIVLKKPASLNKEEFEYMKKHSSIGADMIEKIINNTCKENFLTYARDMALLHHERWDGTGYPCKLKGEAIPIYVRALSIADVYDALTSIRPYKRAFTHEEAIEIMREDSGKFFDPEIFNIFIENEERIKKIPKDNNKEEMS